MDEPVRFAKTREEFRMKPVIVGPSVLALAAALAIPSTANAQSVQPPPAEETTEQASGGEGQRKFVVESDMDVVVVTGVADANPEDAPAAVTAFDAEERNLLSAGTTRQMVDLTPGTYISDFGLNIRGVGRGTGATILGSENSVALYVDGFYNVDAGVIGESTLFGGSVVFQRGPQGTSYGRDAIGGSANLISRAPSDTFRGEAVAAIGREGWSNVGVNVSGPITDSYRYRFGVQQFNQPNSYQSNIAPVKAGFDIDNTYVEFQLDGDVTDRLHFRTRSTHFEYNNSPGYTAPARYNSGGAFMGALVPNPQYRYGVAPPTGAYEFNVDYRGFDKLTENQVHILNADYDFGDVKLYYVGGYAQYVAEGSSDADGTSRRSYIAQPPTPAVPGTVVSTYQTNNYFNDNSYFSHELRLESEAPGPLQWKSGLYYLETDYDESFWNALPDVAALEAPTIGSATGPLAAPNPRRAFYEQRNVLKSISSAVFGEVSYEFTPDVRVTAGLRYTQDIKKARTKFRYVYWYPGAVVLDVTPAISSVQPRLSDSGVTGRLAIDWQPDDDTLVYASYARGYKAGGFTLGDAVIRNVTRPESLDAYEVGAKRELGDVSLDANLFFYNYSDIQVPITAQNTTTGGTFVSYTNADEAEMYGLELQASWRPTDALFIGANYTYLNSRYTSFCCAFDFVEPTLGNQDLSGNHTPRAPEHKFNLFGTYTLDFEPGSLILGATASHTGEMYSNSFTRPQYLLEGYTVSNLTATWRAADNQYDLVASITNVFEEEYATAIGVAGANLGFARTEFLGPPQFYSLTLRYRFE
jgi:iron complex outermembrane receptor protein